jgi:hypothetical protein
MILEKYYHQGLAGYIFFLIIMSLRRAAIACFHKIKKYYKII